MKARVLVVEDSKPQQERLLAVLEARGYDAVNVEGGTNGWINAGFPVER